MLIKKYLLLICLLAAIAGSACRISKSTNNNQNENLSNTARQANLEQSPVIEISPVQSKADGTQIINSETIKLTVKSGAPAQEAQIYFQPVIASDRSLKLKTLIPNGQNNEIFTADLKTPKDLNGEIWAEVRYATGQIKETEHLQIAAQATDESENNNSNTNSNSAQTTTADNLPADTDESARSDKLTNGKIEHSNIQKGMGGVRITVNVPAFLLTLWQGNKEIKTYYVGVGRKKFPIPIGLRSADKIIVNPDWIPPDSEWVRKSSSVEPYQKIPASDPLNPLGKIKIPLGDAYLLHEAESPKDLGNLVSHGCVRVLRDDLFDLTGKIIEAENLAFTESELKAARHNSVRKVIDLNGKMPVDINYDTMVVEKGILSVYPDVYERGTNTVENLRTAFEGYGVEAANLDDKTLQEVLSRVTSEKKFVVSIADVKAGKILSMGKTEPLTPEQAKTQTKKTDD